MGIIKGGISSCAMDEPAQTATCDSNPDPDNFGVECQDGDEVADKYNSFDDNDNNFDDNDNSFDYSDYNFEDNNNSFESHETR